MRKSDRNQTGCERLYVQERKRAIQLQTKSLAPFVAALTIQATPNHEKQSTLGAMRGGGNLADRETDSPDTHNGAIYGGEKERYNQKWNLFPKAKPSGHDSPPRCLISYQKPS
jgi:hypothetical protein